MQKKVMKNFEASEPATPPPEDLAQLQKYA